MVRVWSNNYLYIPEAMRLTLILESLKANEERKDVGRWIVSTVDEGNFNIENQGALEQFLDKFKKKFEIPSWRKCVEIWEQLLAFKRQEDEGPKKYLERWIELEAKINNSREVISPMFLAAHFLEQTGEKDTTKQSILTMVKLEEKKTVLIQIKKAFETLVANFDKEANTSFWGQNNYEGRYSRRDNYDRRYGDNRRYERRDERDERQDRDREEGDRERYEDRRD